MTEHITVSVLQQECEAFTITFTYTVQYNAASVIELKVSAWIKIRNL